MSRPSPTLPRKDNRGLSATVSKSFCTFLTSGWSGATPLRIKPGKDKQHNVDEGGGGGTPQNGPATKCAIPRARVGTRPPDHARPRSSGTFTVNVSGQRASEGNRSASANRGGLAKFAEVPFLGHHTGEGRLAHQTEWAACPTCQRARRDSPAGGTWRSRSPRARCRRSRPAPAGLVWRQPVRQRQLKVTVHGRSTVTGPAPGGRGERRHTRAAGVTSACRGRV